MSNSLTLPKLKRALAPFGDALPKGVNVEFLAKSVLSEFFQVTPETKAWRERFKDAAPKLAAIGTGWKQASKYHKHVFGLLTAIFNGFLTNGKIEQEINTGIHRVDIMFDNTRGVFLRIAKIIRKPCPYLPFECKNYNGDLDAPEYDQLSGRLNPAIGAIGILVFRSIANWDRANRHCQAKLKEGKYIILLDDADLTRMFEMRHSGDVKGMEGVILDRLRSLKLDVPAK